MKKRVAYRKLSRGKDSRRALFRSLIRALVENGSITTTKTRTKVIKPLVDRLVTLAKKNTLSSRRRAMSLMGNDRAVVDKLFGSIAKVFESTTSGFTKVVNLPRRKGDNAQLAKIEWTKEVVEEEVSKEKKGKGEKQIRSKRAQSTRSDKKSLPNLLKGQKIKERKGAET